MELTCLNFYVFIGKAEKWAILLVK